MRVRSIAPAMLPAFVLIGGLYDIAWSQSCPQHSLFEIAAAIKSSKGAPDPVESVEALGADPRAARIRFAGGRTYEVRFGDDRAEARQVQ